MRVTLSPRLNAAASLVMGGGILADIGTDHAYLPIFLVQNGVVNKAIAADIGNLPLLNAKESVERYDLQENISLRLSDGLKGFLPDETDEIVIAGMGGTLIAEILSSVDWVKSSRYHFVFQPQSRAEELREYLYKNGFSIGKELAVHEGRRYYIALEANYTGQVKTPTDLECFLGNLPKTDDAKKFLQNQLNRMETKFEAVKQKENTEETERLSKIVSGLKEFINV